MPAQFCPTCQTIKLYPAGDSAHVVCDTCGAITIQVEQHRPSRLQLLFLSEWMSLVLLLILLVGLFLILLLVPPTWLVNTFIFGFWGVVLLAIIVAVVQKALRRTTPAFIPEDRVGTNQSLLIRDSPWAILLLNVLLYLGLTYLLIDLWIHQLSWLLVIGTLSGGIAGLFSIILLRRNQRRQPRAVAVVSLGDVMQRVNWWFIPGGIFVLNLLGILLRPEWRFAFIACLASTVFLVWGQLLINFYQTRARQYN